MRSFSYSLLFSLDKLLNFKFICYLLLWFDLLKEVNATSKALQGGKMEISLAVKSLKSTISYFKNYRSAEQIAKIYAEATKISTKLEIPSHFEATRADKTPREDFERLFYQVIDQTLSSLDERFETLEYQAQNFALLFNISKLKDYTTEQILQECMKLEKVYTSPENISDFPGEKLASDLNYVKKHPEIFNYETALDLLELLCKYRLRGTLSALYTCLRIFLTLPVSIAHAERTFSKLKLILDFLRTTMTQDRLSDLAVISIEREISSQIDLYKLIQKFMHSRPQKFFSK